MTTDKEAEVRREVQDKLAVAILSQKNPMAAHRARAIVDAIAAEDGLDGLAGERVLQMIRAALRANGQQSPDLPAGELFEGFVEPEWVTRLSTVAEPAAGVPAPPETRGTFTHDCGLAVPHSPDQCWDKVQQRCTYQEHEIRQLQRELKAERDVRFDPQRVAAELVTLRNEVEMLTTRLAAKERP